MYKKIILLYTILFIPFLLTAQIWQWGIRGGGIADNNNSGGGRETVIDMATDANGNLYTLARINANATITINNQTITPQGTNGEILIVSTNCYGQIRWVKVLGGPQNETPIAVATDGANGIYIAGAMASGTKYFDTDTLQSNAIVKRFFIIKYDTSGTYQWLRQPTPDTVTSYANSGNYFFLDIVGSNESGVFALSYLKPGLLGNSNYAITTEGFYILNYNANGTMQPPIPLDMQINFDVTSFNNIRMARMPSGKIILGCRVSGSGNPPTNYNLSVGGQAVNNPILVCMFNANGSLLWKATNTNNIAGALNYRPIIKDGAIYIAPSTNGNLDTLFNIPFINSLGGNHSIPSVLKIDTTGVVIWAKMTAGTNANTNAKALTSNNQIYLAGDYPLRLEWQGQVLQNNFNQGYDIFIAKLDPTTGNVISLDSLDGDFGYNDAATAIVSDNKGNIYIGGEMGNQLYVGNQTLQSSGGTSDFFIAKFGTANCSNVVPITLQHFTAKQKNGQQVQCSWQSLQEINGSHYIVQRGTTPTYFTNMHTIPTAGKPSAYSFTDTLNAGALQGAKNLFYRLVMVEKDGTIQYSNIAAIDLTQKQQIQVYPNPANNHVMLILPYPTQKVEPVQLYNLQGTLVLQTHLNAFTQILNIPIQTLPKATYLIKVKGFATAVVVKE